MKTTIDTVTELEDRLSKPSESLIKELRAIDGDILILGVAGKMGPSLARLALRACHGKKKIFGVARFTDRSLKYQLKEAGIQTFAGDLLDDDFLRSLPDVKNIIYMAGNKFGTAGNEPYTWTMNSYLPGRVADKFRHARIVVFSTGNVYPFVPIDSGGATESMNPEPVGEYGQSCLGRERVFEFFSVQHQIPMLIFRLNYAIDLRYGILHEIAKAVWDDSAIDLTTGYVNMIWQGDANSYALLSLGACTIPPTSLNVTGSETLSVRYLAECFGEYMNKTPHYANAPAPTSLLSNSRKCIAQYGPPQIQLDQMIEWTAHWVQRGGLSLGKPTHFQERKGKF